MLGTPARSRTLERDHPNFTSLQSLMACPRRATDPQANPTAQRRAPQQIQVRSLIFRYSSLPEHWGSSARFHPLFHSHSPRIAIGRTVIRESPSLAIRPEIREASAPPQHLRGEPLHLPSCFPHLQSGDFADRLQSEGGRGALATESASTPGGDSCAHRIRTTERTTCIA